MRITELCGISTASLALNNIPCQCSMAYRQNFLRRLVFQAGMTRVRDQKSELICLRAVSILHMHRLAFRKEKGKVVMAPQTQKSSAKVDITNGKGKPTLAPPNAKTQTVDWAAFLGGISRGKTILEYSVDRTIFAQGDPADSVWYLQHGKVKLAVTSQQGKEAIVTILGDNEFFGEGCLAGQSLRISAATAVTDCILYRIEKPLMVRMLHEHFEISQLFVTHLLSRNIRHEEDLVDQLFNSSEKRLARILLLLAHFGKESRTETVHPGINHEHLAQMVGTTRSRVSHFMNKFRTLGFIDYAGNGALTVNNGLLSVILSE